MASGRGRVIPQGYAIFSILTNPQLLIIPPEHYQSADIYKLDPITQILTPVLVDLDNAQGVSIYWPPTSGGRNYNEYTGGGLYTFTAFTEWDEYIKMYSASSGLPPRPITFELPPVPVWTNNTVFLPFVAR